MRAVAPRVTPRIQIKRPRCGVLTRVEHPLRVIKGILGFRAVQYRGLHKNTQRGYVLCTLAHLYRVRHQLCAQAGGCA